MSGYYLPLADRDAFQQVLEAGSDETLFRFLTDPLHEELYRQQSFDFMDMLSEGQQLFLAYDYVCGQVGQGGFIQLLANGYIGLLPDMPLLLERVGATAMAQVIDDVIRVYVLKLNLFTDEMSNEEFARLYEELKEFEILDQRFDELHTETLRAMTDFARGRFEVFLRF